MLVKHCVLFYQKYWDDRNETHHNLDRQRNKIRRSYEKTKEHSMENKADKVKMFTQRKVAKNCNSRFAMRKK